MEFNFDKETKKFYLPNNMTFEDYFKELTILDDYIMAEINNDYIRFSKNSKKVKFVGKGHNEEIFVVNVNQVIYILNLFEFKRYKIKDKDGNIKKKIDNDLDFDEIIYLENILEKEEYNKVQTPMKEDISLNNLSLLYFDYQKHEYKEDGKFELTKEREDFFNQLKTLIKNNNFIPICGPKSIGKTTSILYYAKKNYKNQYFYINLSYCKNLLLNDKYEQLYLCICKELCNCLKFEEITQFYNYISNQKYSNIMKLVLGIIQYLDKNFINNQFFIIIDQYKEKIDKKYNIIQEIELRTKVDDRFNILVCSSINEYDLRNSIQNRLKQNTNFYLNFLFVNKLIYIKDNNLTDFKDEEKELLKQSGNLFQFYYKILENKSYKNKGISEIKKEIMNHIIEDINEYFDENDYEKKKEIIRTIHQNIDQKKKFIELKENLNLFPFKYFNLNVNNKNFFRINDLKEDTEIIISESYPIVIDCINQIFQSSKYELKKLKGNKLTVNIKKAIQYINLEENFNDYLWLYRKNNNFYECKIIEKILITSLLNLNDEDAKTISNCTNNITNINESILITLRHQNAKHFDTGILKLKRIDTNNIKYFELYLFQETLKKKAEERLSITTLNEDKACLKYLFFIKSSIRIENIFFSYIFNKDSLDTTTMNYCQENKINYQIYEDQKPDLQDSGIETKIRLRVEYPILPKENEKEKEEFLLDNLEIDYSVDKRKLENQYERLKEFLSKKRNITNNDDELNNKIKSFQKYVNSEFRNYEIRDKTIQEFLMNQENEDIPGISYIVDNKTQKYLKDIKFSKKELKNLFSLMNFYNSDLDILKIIKLKGVSTYDIQNYDCALISIKDKEKFFIDLKKKMSYLLSENKLVGEAIILGEAFYLIKFAPKKIISYVKKTQKNQKK